MVPLDVATLPLLSAGLAVASATLFFLVARAVRTRAVSAASVPARNAFVLWWGCLSLVTVAGALMSLPAFPRSVGLFLAITVVNLALLCVALWGLLFYLVFLFTNRRDLARPLGVAYVGYFVFLLYFIVSGDPTSVETTTWGPKLVYADPIDSGPVYWAAVLLLILPPFVAAAGYLSLYWKVDQRFQKQRILLVSVSIMAWFGSALVGTGLAQEGSDWWRVTSRLIGLAAAGTILYAYRGLKPSAPVPTVTSPPSSGEAPLYSPPRKGVTQVQPLLA